MIQFFEVLPRRRHRMAQDELILYNLAKVGVEGSNPFARSIILIHFYSSLCDPMGPAMSVVAYVLRTNVLRVRRVTNPANPS